MSHSEIYHPSVGGGGGKGGGGVEEMGDISDYSCRSLLGLKGTQSAMGTR